MDKKWTSAVIATNHAKPVCFHYLLWDIYFSYVKDMTLSKVKEPEEVNIYFLQQFFLFGPKE